MSVEKILMDLTSEIKSNTKVISRFDSDLLIKCLLELGENVRQLNKTIQQNNLHSGVKSEYPEYAEKTQELQTPKKPRKKVEDQANKVETAPEEKVVEPVKVESASEVVVDVASKVAELQREGFLVPNLKIALTSLGVEKVAKLEGAKKLQFYKFLGVISSEEVGKDIFNKMTSSQIKEQIAKCEAVNV